MRFAQGSVCWTRRDEAGRFWLRVELLVATIIGRLVRLMI
jgi:hypothetical protein